MSYKQIMENTDVNHKTIQESVAEGSRVPYKYARWYLELVKAAADMKSVPFYPQIDTT